MLSEGRWMRPASLAQPEATAMRRSWVIPRTTARGRWQSATTSQPEIRGSSLPRNRIDHTRALERFAKKLRRFAGRLDLNGEYAAEAAVDYAWANAVADALDALRHEADAAHPRGRS
jgi:hypothetical protein